MLCSNSFEAHEDNGSPKCFFSKSVVVFAAGVCCLQATGEFFLIKRNFINLKI